MPKQSNFQSQSNPQSIPLTMAVCGALIKEPWFFLYSNTSPSAVGAEKTSVLKNIPIYLFFILRLFYTFPPHIFIRL